MNRPVGLIAEDEAPQRRELIDMLAMVWPELEIQIECADGLTAIESLRERRPDVAFLDIRMPGVSGLEVARHVPASSRVVFITAYAGYAVQAFETGAIDYLLKPLSRERLQRTVDRVRGQLGTVASPHLGQVLQLLRNQAATPPPQAMRWVSASVGNTLKMLPIDHVLFFQSRDKYTRVVTASDEAIIRLPLRELLSRLDAEEFWQVHRSVIVRVSAIRAVCRTPDEHYQLVIAGSAERLPVSPAFRDRFKAM
jgi:DNA-binding LytR/AlgR family response regulator